MSFLSHSMIDNINDMKFDSMIYHFVHDVMRRYFLLPDIDTVVYGKPESDFIHLEILYKVEENKYDEIDVLIPKDYFLLKTDDEIDIDDLCDHSIEKKCITFKTKTIGDKTLLNI